VQFRANRAVTPTSWRAREHIAKGLTVREAAVRVKVSKTALYQALGSELA